MNKIRKYNHPSQTLIYVVYKMAKILKERRVVTFADLRNNLRKSIDGSDFYFVEALDVLFLHGKINYFPKNDTLEFVEDEIK